MYDCYFSKEAILLIIAAFGVFSVEMQGCSNPAKDPKKVCLKDSKLDIVLMFDQSGSIPFTNYEQYFRGAFLKWIDDFFHTPGAYETQFAILGCGNLEIIHSFADGNFKVEIPRKIFQMTTYGGNDNLDACSKKAVQEIFTPSAGDRDDAKNVALWISDCKCEEFDGRLESHMHAAKVLMVDKKADFFFVCCKDKDGTVRADEYHRQIMQWLAVGNKSSDNIIKYENNDEQVGKKIIDNTIVEEKLVDIVDCVVNEALYKQCSYDSSVGQCTEGDIYLIDRQPYPTTGDKRGKECPKNVSKQCSGCVSGETPVYLPATATGVHVQNATGQDASATGGEDIANAKDGTSEKKSPMVWIIVGVALGLFLLLLLLLLLVFLVVRRRRNQKIKQEALSNTRQEKGKGVQVDISVMGDSKMQKTSKKQASVQSKKSTVQPKKPADDRSNTATKKTLSKK